jgi:hypothetical protein
MTACTATHFMGSLCYLQYSTSCVLLANRQQQQWRRPWPDDDGNRDNDSNRDGNDNDGNGGACNGNGDGVGNGNSKGDGNSKVDGNGDNT